MRLCYIARVGVSAPRHQVGNGLKTVSRPTAATFNGRFMDTSQLSFFSDEPAHACSPADLAAQSPASDAPLLIDVRKHGAFIDADSTLPSALRRDPLQLDAWVNTLPAARAVCVYCVHGHEVSQGVARALRAQGRAARFLVGGIEAWRAQGLPLSAKPVGSATCWVTRERPKIDRIACPWLIRRFVDAQAQFLYVPTSEVQAVARAQIATPYDVNASVADTPFTHDGARCSFDAFVRIFHLHADTALARLADIVRAADTDQLDLAPQAAGLLAVSMGMSRNIPDDDAMLEAMMPVYDALYAWCRDAAAGQDEAHNWKTA
jgi:rhodanese-related sulfurtransferase